jgi:thymidylate synthase (FAD)
VDLGEITYVMPPSIARDPEAMQIYQETMKIIWGAYRTLAELVPREDARYVLPNGCTTNIIVTMNARELLHFFSLRLCGRAQWEIRQLAHEMWMQADQVSPALFDGAGPGCVRGPCPEGKNTCGKPWEKKVKRNGKDASTTDKS